MASGGGAWKQQELTPHSGRGGSSGLEGPPDSGCGEGPFPGQRRRLPPVPHVGKARGDFPRCPLRRTRSFNLSSVALICRRRAQKGSARPPSCPARLPRPRLLARHLGLGTQSGGDTSPQWVATSVGRRPGSRRTQRRPWRCCDFLAPHCGVGVGEAGRRASRSCQGRGALTGPPWERSFLPLASSLPHGMAPCGGNGRGGAWGAEPPAWTGPLETHCGG